jgi:DNA-binding transcriptional MerR regulator
MEWTKVQLSEVEEWSKHGFTIQEISIALDLQEEMLRNEYLSKTDFYKAYQKCVLTTELAVRKSVIRLAEMGHVQAQSAARKIRTSQKINDE